jgi:threonine/homoserine/homoserine lactone efflux protein
VLLDLFLIGLVVNLEPIPLSAMILLLAAERGVRKGAGFVLGWLLTLVVIVAATVLATDGWTRAGAARGA